MHLQNKYGIWRLIPNYCIPHYYINFVLFLSGYGNIVPNDAREKIFTMILYITGVPYTINSLSHMAYIGHLLWRFILRPLFQKLVAFINWVHSGKLHNIVWPRSSGNNTIKNNAMHTHSFKSVLIRSTSLPTLNAPLPGSESVGLVRQHRPETSHISLRKTVHDEHNVQFLSPGLEPDPFHHHNEHEHVSVNHGDDDSDKDEDTKVETPGTEQEIGFFAAIMLILIYIVPGVIAVSTINKWDVIDSFYFLMTSATTVGLGDLVVNNISYMVMSPYLHMLVGLVYDCIQRATSATIPFLTRIYSLWVATKSRFSVPSRTMVRGRLVGLKAAAAAAFVSLYNRIRPGITRQEISVSMSIVGLLYIQLNR